MTIHSDYWLDGYDWNFDSKEDSNIDLKPDLGDDKLFDLIKLSQAKKAVSNYVNILTNKSIPVTFYGNNSYTDGKSIFISAAFNKRNKFDANVGLALHEASHILYTDFNLIKKCWSTLPNHINEKVRKLKIHHSDFNDFFKLIFNYVEDRFIDRVVYEGSPGYRLYYKSMYDCYFNFKTINRALKSELYRVPSLESYTFRIVNLTNVNTDVNALPGLNKIISVLDLKNITRLHTCEERMRCAESICDIVLDNIISINSDEDSEQFEQFEQSEQFEESMGESEEGGDSDKNNDDPFSNPNGLVSSLKNDVKDFNDDVVGDIGSDEKIKQSGISRIKSSFSKQKKFLQNNVRKTKISDRLDNDLKLIEESNSELINVGSTYSHYGKNVSCIVVNDLNLSYVMNRNFPMSVSRFYGRSTDLINLNDKYISEGISLGNKIGKRLQLRNESYIEKFSRRTVGRIDKKLLHECGFQNENIFYNELTTRYKKLNFHLSIDASSSMNGCKWNKTIKLTSALAKAFSMLDDVKLTISFRTTFESKPYLVFAYNSDKDKFHKIKSVFRYLHPVHTTPEGLTYEALLKKLDVPSNEYDNYFINISDGMPFCQIKSNTGDSFEYRADDALKHTNEQVSKIRNFGYDVISYYVSEYISSNREDRCKTDFRKMYGKDSSFIDVESFNEISNVINLKLLENYVV